MARNLPEQIEAEIMAPSPPRKKKELTEDMLVPSGSTMLNLACTDTPHGAYMLGGLVTIPGASGAGKTLEALTCLAECTYLPRLNDYALIHDDAEERMSFDLAHMFSERVAERVVCPPLGRSKTIQQFKANMLTLQNKKLKSIYVLDSLDSLASDEELEKEMRKALAMAKSAEAAKKIAGSYGMEKAKITGEILRIVNNWLKESNSLLLMTQQLRQNVGGGPFDPEYTTSGGEAPYFYSNHQIWMTKGAMIKKRELEIGRTSRAKVVKNSATGKERTVEFNIYNEFGIDDTSSCVDWMMSWGFWKERSRNKVSGIDAAELELFEPSKNDLVRAIEEKGLVRRMQRAVGKAWLEVEESLKQNRRRRYED